MIKAKNIKEIEELICDKKVFLFDFDGVVAHTERLQWEAYNIVLEKYNIIITKEKWLNYIGTSEREIYKMIKKEFNIEFDEDLMLKKRLNVYLKLVRQKKLKPFSTFIELLNEYTEKKYYILTSNIEEVVKDMLKYWGIFDRFEEIISVATRGITKKDILMNTNEYLKVQNSDIAYFEDMDRNLKMASELNITTIGIEHEFNYNKLDNCNAILTGEPI